MELTFKQNCKYKLLSCNWDLSAITVTTCDSFNI